MMLSLLLAVLVAFPSPLPSATSMPTLRPLPEPSLRAIGSTRNRPVCVAIRQAVGPALEAAMRNDQLYVGMRSRIYDYLAKDSETARDLHIVAMDRDITRLVKSTDALDDATKSTALRPSSSTAPEDAATMRQLQSSLVSILEAQKVQLDALSGFVDTERARKFGQLDESQQQAQRSSLSDRSGASPSPVSAFLRDSSYAVTPEHQTPQGLSGAKLIDRDLGDMASATLHRETAATRVIVAAVSLCKGP